MNDQVDGNTDVLAQDSDQSAAEPQAPGANAEAGTPVVETEAADGVVDQAQAYQPEDVSNLTTDPANMGGGDVNLDAILDIPVKVTVEIGRTQVPVRDLMQYGPGSVVELERLVGEPLDVLINGTMVASGEVVVVNDKFGVRLTDVIPPSNRMQSLK